MKLVYLANIGLPAYWAHEIQIMKMCEAFALNGAEVELVVPRRSRNIKEDLFDLYGVKDIFKITQLSSLDPMPGSASRFIFWLKLFSFLNAAKSYLRGQRYDVLYTREQVVARFFKNYVLEIHSLPEIIKPFHKKIWQQASFLMVLTSFIKKELIDNGIPENKIMIAPDGVDIGEFNLDLSQSEARQKTRLPSDKKIILYTGSFYLRDWKGVDVLLEAAKQFSGDCNLVLVGGELSEIRKIKDEYQLRNLILIDRQPHTKIPYYLKAADVLVLPNKKGDAMSEKYTSPMKLFEYMAAGRPIVASDLLSVREILDESNSVLVPPNNPIALAEGIKKVLSDQQLGYQLAQKALEHVSEFTWINRAKKIFDKIKERYDQ